MLEILIYNIDKLYQFLNCEGCFPASRKYKNNLNLMPVNWRKNNKNSALHM